MHWPFNYPGDEYLTNVFGQVIVLLEDIKDGVVDFVEDIKEEITHENH